MIVIDNANYYCARIVFYPKFALTYPITPNLALDQLPIEHTGMDVIFFHARIIHFYYVNKYLN